MKFADRTAGCKAMESLSGCDAAVIGGDDPPPLSCGLTTPGAGRQKQRCNLAAQYDTADN